MADSIRTAKKSKFSGGFVTVAAGTGDERQEFHVHEDVIKEQSQYFRKAFDAKCQEGKTRVIELPEDEAAIVACYVDWFYSHSISIPSIIDLPILSDKSIIINHLLRLYIFGEKIQDDAFCNEALCASMRLSDEKDEEGARWFPTKEDVAIIYDGTPEGSPARQLMVYLHVRYGSSSWIAKQYEENHPQFLVDLCKALLGKVQELDREDSYVGSLYDMRHTWMKRCKK